MRGKAYASGQPLVSLVVVPPREVEEVERKVGGPVVAVQKQMAVELLPHQEEKAMVQQPLEVMAESSSEVTAQQALEEMAQRAFEEMAQRASEEMAQRALEEMAQQDVEETAQWALVEMARGALVVTFDQQLVLERADCQLARRTLKQLSSSSVSSAPPAMG